MPVSKAFAALKAELAATAAAPLPADALISSGIAELDRVLGGGFPRGALAVLEGDAGRWSIAARLAARVTATGLAAVIDDGGLYPPSLQHAGARLDRVLIAPATTPLAAARAADILLRSRACRLVVMTAPNLRPAVWSRLATLAHRAGVLLVAIVRRAGSALAAVAGLRLDCTLERVLLHGSRGLWCSFAGYDIRAEVRKRACAGASPAGACACVRAAETFDGAALRSSDCARVARSAQDDKAEGWR